MRIISEKNNYINYSHKNRAGSYCCIFLIFILFFILITDLSLPLFLISLISIPGIAYFANIFYEEYEITLVNDPEIKSKIIRRNKIISKEEKQNEFYLKDLVSIDLESPTLKAYQRLVFVTKKERIALTRSHSYRYNKNSASEHSNIIIQWLNKENIKISVKERFTNDWKGDETKY